MMTIVLADYLSGAKFSASAPSYSDHGSDIVKSWKRVLEESALHMEEEPNWPSKNSESMLQLHFLTAGCEEVHLSIPLELQARLETAHNGVQPNYVVESCPDSDDSSHAFHAINMKNIDESQDIQLVAPVVQGRTLEKGDMPRPASSTQALSVLLSGAMPADTSTFVTLGDSVATIWIRDYKHKLVSENIESISGFVRQHLAKYGITSVIIMYNAHRYSLSHFVPRG